MDSMDNCRERSEALGQQMEHLQYQIHALESHTRTVERRLRRWRAIAGSLLVLGLLSWALPTGVDVASAQTSIEAGPITRVTVVRGAACEPTCDRAILTTTADPASRAFMDVPDASAQITVEKKSLLIARFAADSTCVAQVPDPVTGLLDPAWCSVRILASVGPGGDFVEMEPVTSIFEAFEVHEGAGAHAIERSSGPVSPGTYTVQVQFSIPFGIAPGARFTLTAWHLTVEGATIID